MAENDILIQCVDQIVEGSDWPQWSDLKKQIQDWAVLSHFQF